MSLWRGNHDTRSDFTPWLGRRKQRFRPVVKMKRKVGQGGKLIWKKKKRRKIGRNVAQLASSNSSILRHLSDFTETFRSLSAVIDGSRGVFSLSPEVKAQHPLTHALCGFVIKIHWAFGKDCKSPRSFSNISCLPQSKGAGRNHHVCGEFERWLGCYGLPFRAVYSPRLI